MKIIAEILKLLLDIALFLPALCMGFAVLPFSSLYRKIVNPVIFFTYWFFLFFYTFFFFLYYLDPEISRLPATSITLYKTYETWGNFYLDFPLEFSFDGGVFSLIYLTHLVVLTCLQWAAFEYRSVENLKYLKFFFVSIVALHLFLNLTFLSISLFYYYFFFECTLIPIFFMIGFGGSRRRRIKAAYYLYLYTLFPSLLLLISFVSLYLSLGDFNYFSLLYGDLPPFYQQLFWIALFLTFAVKMPIYPFHLWLPEAHVEAPTVGSVLLAALLLKLGSFGIYRFLIPTLPLLSFTYAPYILVLGLISIIYGSLVALRQTDIKKIIAYSSIAHMSFILVAFFVFNHIALDGSFFLMLGHGLISSGLFFGAGFLYTRFGTKLILYYGGLARFMPLGAMFFFLFVLGNIAFPSTSNFVGEILILLGVASVNLNILFLMGGGVILSAAYSVLMYNRIFFGEFDTRYLRSPEDLSREEIFVFLLLLFFVLLLGLFSVPFLNLFSALSLEIEQIYDLIKF